MTIPEDSPNRWGLPYIQPSTRRRHAGAMEELNVVSHRQRAAAAGGFLVLALVAAGCGGSGAAPSSGAGPSPTSSPAASIAVSLAPTGTPAPTVPVGPALQLLWEKAGAKPAQGHNPATYWPAIDPPTGNIWVAVSTDNVYWIFKADGSFVGTFGSSGTGDGQFNFQRTACADCYAGAIAFAPDGSFFVADDGNNRIQKFDAQHHFVKAWGSFGSGDGQFADANGIVTDGKLVYVADDVRTDIQAFDVSGTFVRTMTTNVSDWMTIDASGNLYTAYDKGIMEYDPTGAQAHAYALPAFDGWRIGLARDPAGRLYFDIQNNDTGNALGLVRFDPATGSLQRWPTGGETLLVDPSGQAIYEANYVSNGWPSAVLRKYALPTP